MSTLWMAGSSRLVGFTAAEVEDLLALLRTIIDATYSGACATELAPLQAEAGYFAEYSLSANYIDTDRRIPGTSSLVPEEYIGGGWLTQTEHNDVEQLFRDFVALRERCSWTGRTVVGVYLPPGLIPTGTPDEPDDEPDDSEMPLLGIPDVPSGDGLSTGAKVGIGVALASGALLLGTVLLKGAKR